MRVEVVVGLTSALAVGAAPGGPVSRDVGVPGMEVAPPEAAVAVLDAMERGANAARACHADPLAGAGAPGETVALSFHVRSGRALGARVDPWVRQDVGACVQKALRDWSFAGVPDADVSWTFAVMPSAGPAPVVEATGLDVAPPSIGPAVQRALDRRAPDVRACREAHPSGASVVLGFAVYGGRVESTYTIASGGDPALATCVLERLRGWPFPSNVEGDAAWTVP